MNRSNFLHAAQAERHADGTAWWRGPDMRLWPADSRLDLASVRALA